MATTRSSSAAPQLLKLRNADQQGLGTSDPATKSVIGNDLRIIGKGLKIISQGTLLVDGQIEGDVGGSDVIIGELGKVTGIVAAERVTVRGTVSGVIRGATVVLQSSARVEGDINHMLLSIEQGAEFDGRCKRYADASEVALTLDDEVGS